MMKVFLLFLALFLSVNSYAALGPDYAFVNDLINCNQIAVAPVFHSPNAEEFAGEIQEALIQDLNSIGALEKVLEIRNSFAEDRIVSVYVVLGEKKEILGLISTSNIYTKAHTRNAPRFHTLAQMRSGAVLAKAMDRNAVKVVVRDFNAQNGGNINLAYVTSLRAQAYESMPLELKKVGDRWSLMKDGKIISKAMADISVSLIRLDGGVRSIAFD